MAGTETSRPEPTTRSSPGAADLLAGCQRVVVAQDAALHAAAVTLDDWQVHVGAMNKFVVGAVTVDQLNAFWDRTGMDAITRLRDFDDAAGALRTGCPRPAQVDRDAGLRACVEAASSRRDALRSAHTAAETWAAELRDMQQLRAGAQSASQARDAWLRTWQTAVRQLEDYRRTVREVSEDAACTS